MKIFQSNICAKITFKNRILRAGTAENMADESGKMIKKQVNIPVIVVGGIRKLSEMKQMIENQWVDMISLSRPLIIEPSFVRKMQEGKSEESKCIECNYCLIGSLYMPLRCYCGKTPQV